ncbi:MAG: ligase-associated DNA damage response endonuclease PdeM [Alphaproteobacteria bacterium]
MAEAARNQAVLPAPVRVGVAGVVLEAFCEGILWWADEGLLCVADLHLEKGSALARRGQLVPPYDTAETLARLEQAVARLSPRVVVALGDSFHDDGGPARMAPGDAARLAGLRAGREWIWIAGNHDPVGAARLGGTRMDELILGRITFRHEPGPPPAAGEIAGHLHPSARVYGRGKSVRRRCFVGDGHRLIMPAFGAYTGGLDIRDRAYAGLFDAATLRAYMLGEGRVYAVGGRALRPRS